MSFASDVAAHQARLRERFAALEMAVVDHVEMSIKVGCSVTGAPGQPVDTGALLSSYQREEVAPHVTEIASTLVYAPVIETNERGAVFKSAVGGAHSIAMTRVGFPALVDHEAEKLG